MSRRAMSEQTFLVLTVLAEEPLHGYGIVRSVRALSEDRMTLRVGTLYGVLDRLSDDGLVGLDREEVHDGRLRRYYRVTEAGLTALAREAATRAETARVAAERLRARGVRVVPGGSAG